MHDHQTEAKPGEGRTLHLYYIAGIIGITIILLILRIVFDLIGTTDDFALLRDVDYRTLHDHSSRGVVDYYKESSIKGFRAIYLYYWYFIFFPIYLLPIGIGIYVWDILRLVSSIYVARNIYRITENSTDIIIFFILSGLGYFADAYLNNTNWLIQLFLFESYLFLQRDNKLISGIIFALSCYKINIIIFPFIILIVKKIKIKDLIYYFIPLFILCLPYLIFPDYLSQLFYNWTYVEEGDAGSSNLFIRVYLISWQAFQTAQMMFMALFLIVFIQNLQDERWKGRLRWIIFIFLIAINLSFPLILWQIT